MSTSVLIIDDHKMFAELLRATIGAQPDFEVVGHSSDGAEGLALGDQLLPDIVLMHKSDDGIEATAKMTQQRPDARVVILTGYAGHDMLQRAAAANARGLHLLEAGLERLFWVLRHTEREGLAVHPEVLHRWFGGGVLMPRGRQSQPVALTRREMDVLRLLATGLDNRSIAREAGMSPHTCNSHKKSIFMKLDAHTQLEAVAKAHQQGLLQGWSDQIDGELLGTAG